MDCEDKGSGLCTFIKKRKSRATRRRNSSSGSDDGVEIVRKNRKCRRINPLMQSTAKGWHDHNESNGDDETDSRSSIVVAYKGSKEPERVGPTDMGATAEYQLDTDYAQDTQAVFEKAQQINKEMKGKADDKVYRGMANYAQYIEKKDTALGNAASGFNRCGPIRAPTNLRATVRWDYQPDVCKDYKETGFCGFGDSCKFLHDRSDYKHGWQLERDAASGGGGGGAEADEDEHKYEIHSDESGDDADGLPFRCAVCRQSFTDPVVTKCGHYFCEACALAQYRRTARCYLCSADTKGTFNVAKNLIKKFKSLEAASAAAAADQDGAPSDSDDGGHDGGAAGEGSVRSSRVQIVIPDAATAGAVEGEDEAVGGQLRDSGDGGGTDEEEQEEQEKKSAFSNNTETAAASAATS